MSSNEKPSELKILRDALMDTFIEFDIDNDEDLYMLPVEQFDDIVTYLARQIVNRSNRS